MKKITAQLILFFVLYLFSGGTILAEITFPYTLDEKPQAMFGDSPLITTDTSTYQGLENYTHDYIGGYLHITFTYTHAGCCTASYPPMMYMTSADPMATTTLVEKGRFPVYALSPQPTHMTGLYFYDVLFDLTGYHVVITASSTEVVNYHQDSNIALTNSDYIALTNMYPRQDPVTQYSVSFTPLPIYYSPPPTPPTPTATTTPVIIVPGITASVLKDGPTEKWPNTILMGFSFEDLYLDDLMLNNIGENLGSIQADSIVRYLLGHDFFSGLFSKLSSSGYTENTDLFEFPYDWRLDVSTSALGLKSKIEAIKLQTGVDKVDLVAHSMGGLVVKKYLKDYGGGSIDKFVDIGTPHTGAAKAFKILSYGDNFNASFLFGLFGLNSRRIKSISQNMPSIYELLPSRSYFSDYPYYVFNSSDTSERLSFDQTSSYLKTSGRNSVLVDRADAFHQEVDGLNPADYGVETYNIVGCGTPTIGQFYLFDTNTDHPEYNIHFVSGDGTVPLKSAEALQATSTYYVRGIAHALLPSTSGVKELVASLLSTTTAFDLSPYSNLSTSAGGCDIPNGKIVSFHSPIDLNIYDTLGHHVGPDANGDIESEIDGVVYEVLGDNKFAFLPDGADYTVRGSATSAGTFDVRIQEVVGGEVATTTIFTNLPLTHNTQSTFAIGSTTPSQVHLDNNSDGEFEIAYNSASVSSGILESTGKLKPVTTPKIKTNPGTLRTEPPIQVALIATTTSTKKPLQPLALMPKVNNLAPAPVATNTQTNLNTAIVSNSSVSKLKTPFKKLWLWFKKKL